MIASLFIDLTISCFNIPGADTPTNKSAPTNASERPPFILSGFVISANASFASSIFSIPLYKIPTLSIAIKFFTPEDKRSLEIAAPAAPAPSVTTATKFPFEVY